ncbi:MAG: undecaprenyldiphospho-muramoylpentapeptide beta-N-acetylglucosaminyltransferase [Chitinophagaceae bacterium]
MSKVIIAGGGTGGHIFPALAIANALAKRDPAIEILFVGAEGKMEMEKIPQAGYKIIGIDIAGLQRGSIVKNLSLPIKLIKSYFEVKKIFKDFWPDAVIGVGGYSTFPVLRYAQRRRIPTFIHESNSFAGKSNILLGKHATEIFVAWDGMDRFFPANKIIKTGNPVRKNIVDATVSHAEAIRSFGLDPNKKTVLVVGGSLGARSINQAILGHLGDFATLNIQLIWQTGKVESLRFKQKGEAFHNFWIGEFIQNMDAAYAAADVVVSRAGAMSITELCIAKKAAILVPYPYAAEDHQTVNASYLVNKQAAIMIKDDQVQSQLFGTVTNLLFDDARVKALEENISPIATPNANELIVDEILKYIKK